MPYVSKAALKAASKMTRTQVIEHIRSADGCDEPDALRQMAQAIGDRKLWPEWEDPRQSPFGTRSLGILSDDEDTPPTDCNFWLHPEIDPADKNQIREPRRYDPNIVQGKEATKLDAQRRFRKPLFPKHHVLMTWRTASLAERAVRQAALDHTSQATPPELVGAPHAGTKRAPFPQKKRGPRPAKQEAAKGQFSMQLYRLRLPRLNYPHW